MCFCLQWSLSHLSDSSYTPPGPNMQDRTHHSLLQLNQYAIYSTYSNYLCRHAYSHVRHSSWPPADPTITNNVWHLKKLWATSAASSSFFSSVPTSHMLTAFASQFYLLQPVADCCIKGFHWLYVHGAKQLLARLPWDLVQTFNGGMNPNDLWSPCLNVPWEISVPHYVFSWFPCCSCCCCIPSPFWLGMFLIE